MESFFGIGVFELFLIAVIALVVLGPERLPGAMRTIAGYLRQIRNMGSELTSQFSEEIKMLEEIDPRRIINDALDPAKMPASSKSQPSKSQPAKSQPAKTAVPSGNAAKSTTAAAAAVKSIAPTDAATPPNTVPIDGSDQNTILPADAAAAPAVIHAKPLAALYPPSSGTPVSANAVVPPTASDAHTSAQAEDAR